MKMKFCVVAVLVFCSGISHSEEADTALIGVQKDGRILVPTNQVLTPAGKQITFPGRPVDMRLSSDGKTLIVKNMSDVTFIDIESVKITSTLSLGGTSVTGLANTDDRIYVSDAAGAVHVAEKQANGAFAWGKSLAVPAAKVGGKAHPAGLALSGGKLWVTSTRGNCVFCIDPKSGEVLTRVPVGVAPFGICFVSPEKAYVSNWGGEMPKAEDVKEDTAGTMARVDPSTSVVNDGSVSVLTLTNGAWAVSKSIEVGLHPSSIITSVMGALVYVANANSDTVSVINTTTDTVVETIDCRPEKALPFGSGSNALALSPDGSRLYVANGTNNCVAVVLLGPKAADRPWVDEVRAPTNVLGLIPTGWYPAALQVSADGKKLFVANLKGHGLLSERKAKGHTSSDYLGSISIFEFDDEWAKYTKMVNDNNRLAHALAGLEAPRADAKPVPVPERHGEPSVFKHVIYVIRENKTYDQVFGDMKEGNGDKNLCVFPEEITPNAHALAREFTLFDNFYCSGCKSPDGHSWVNEAYVTDYLERAFGGFTRSYPYEGSDALAFAPTGFLWNNALKHGKTFRNYGEFCRSSYTPRAKWKDVYDDYKNGTNKIKIQAEPNMQSLKAYSHPGYPGFPLTTPDVMRAKIFLDEFKEFEKKGDFPNLTYLFLPQDHTNGVSPGSPTPRAMVADNDLALGQVVEAVSKSKFWPETCIFIVQDDPQSGYDHVDGHRTIALVISPYTRRKFVDHTNYTQPGMVKTIELVLGIPPMTQLDLSAPAMRSCFQTEPNLAPFTAVPARIALDEITPGLKQLKGAELEAAKKSLAMNFEDADDVDDDELNRIIWHAMKGYNAPYPSEFADEDAEKN